MALENVNVPIVRYLIVEKGVSVFGEKDVLLETLCHNLIACLHLVPKGNFDAGNKLGSEIAPDVEHIVF